MFSPFSFGTNHMENHKIKYLACSNEITFNKKESIEATLLSD